MSLETVIAGLVEASNKLTSEVAAKMQGIDKKVDDATASVPDVMRDKARQTFYIDAVEGDNNHSGSGGEPLKDWEGVKSRLIPQFETAVRFRGGQTHVISGDGPTYAGFVDITGWDHETFGLPTIKMAFDDVREGKAYGSFLSLSNAVVRMTRVRIESELDGSGIDLHESSAFFGRYPGSSIVILDGCEVSLKNAPLAHQFPGYATTDFMMRNSTITKHEDSNDQGVMVRNSSNQGENVSIRLDLHNVSFVGSTLEEQFGASDDYSNILSNLSLGA